MKYMMNTKELARLTVINGTLDGAYTVKQAAKKFGMSTRCVKHLKKAVREQGNGAVIHGNAGRRPANTTDKALRNTIIALKKSEPYRSTGERRTMRERRVKVGELVQTDVSPFDWLGRDVRYCLTRISGRRDRRSRAVPV
jgi:transposase